MGVMDTEKNSLKGRGLSLVPSSPYEEYQLSLLDTDGLDLPLYESPPLTRTYTARPKSILNRVTSPDIPVSYSMNPYQGCEHGCVYCYARKSHIYWGLSPGLEFETRIIVKKEAPNLLEKAFCAKKWQPTPVMLSGNTDCYQPLERKTRITRACLKVFLRYGNPVGIITKNTLVTRDIDILVKMAKKGLVKVYISLTTFNEQLRRVMEPRTASSEKRLECIEVLSSLGIPTGVMIAPLIPGLNDYEMPTLLQRSAAQGARTAGYSLLRLDDQLAPMFKNWLQKHFPEKAKKVWHKICEVHGGNPIDKKFGQRIRGTGTLAHTIQQLFRISKRKYFQNQSMPSYNLDLFELPHKASLF